MNLRQRGSHARVSPIATQQTVQCSLVDNHVKSVAWEDVGVEALNICYEVLHAVFVLVLALHLGDYDVGYVDVGDVLAQLIELLAQFCRVIIVTFG